MVLGFFINALGPLVESLKPWRIVSPHYHYIGYDPLANGLDLGHAAALLAMTSIFVVFAVIVFERRHLRG